MCDNPAHSHGRVNRNRLGEFHKALDLSGIQVVVNLRGATYCCGLERTGYLPVLFRLQDERLFYGRYSRNGLSELRSPEPGTTLLQMSDEDAQIQCEKENIRIPSGLTEGPRSLRTLADDPDLDREGYAPNPPADSRPDSEQRAASPPEPVVIHIGSPPPTATPCPDGESKSPEAPAELPDLVTLDQAAAAAHTSKRTLERHKTQGTLPEPVREGGGGKHALYDWKVMRPWLTETFGINLPETFPANRK